MHQICSNLFRKIDNLNQIFRIACYSYDTTARVTMIYMVSFSNKQNLISKRCLIFIKDCITRHMMINYYSGFIHSTSLTRLDYQYVYIFLLHISVYIHLFKILDPTQPLLKKFPKFLQ